MQNVENRVGDPTSDTKNYPSPYIIKYSTEEMKGGIPLKDDRRISILKKLFLYFKYFLKNFYVYLVYHLCKKIIS